MVQKQRIITWIHTKNEENTKRKSCSEKNDDSKYCDNIAIYISLNRSEMAKVLITSTQQASERGKQDTTISRLA